MSKRLDYEAAKRKVNEIKGLYVHAAIYGFVVVTLFVVDIATGSPYWIHWVALGWGLGLAGHYVLVQGSMPSALHEWENRKIKELMDEGSEPSSRSSTGRDEAA